MVRFGLAIGLLSSLFKMTKCLLNFRKNGFKISDETSSFIAGCVSVLALMLVNEKELSLLKIIIYPRAIEFIVNELLARGIIKKFEF